MRQVQIFSAVAVFAASAVSAYDKFYFSGEKMEYKCDGFAFGCPPPQVCAHDALLDKMYCCGAGASAVCWTGSSDCSGQNDKPASSQVGCSSNSFCCLKDREECTQRENQINICWATPENPFINTTEKVLNDTFSSISSNRPSATSYTFNIDRIFPTTTSVSSSASDASSASITDGPSSTNPAPTSGTAAPPSNDDGGLSGGAIGGIVVGVVGGLAMIGAGAFFFWRRKKVAASPSQAELDNNPYTQNGYSAVTQSPPQEKYAFANTPGESTLPPQEMAANSAPVEVEGSMPPTATPEPMTATTSTTPQTKP